MRSEADHYFNAPRGIALLWVAVLVGPIAWFLHQQVGYLVATFACRSGGGGWLHVVTGIALLITGVGAIIACAAGGGWVVDGLHVVTGQ